MSRSITAIIMAALTVGCSSEWRTSQPTTPITYKVPAYRTERTVGNLMWLAVLPVRLYNKCRLFGVGCESSTDPELTYDATFYLSEQKGYQIIPVVDYWGDWRPEIVVKSEFGSVDELRKAWDSARTQEEISAAVRRIGAALQVDGIVSMWAYGLEHYKLSPAGRIFFFTFILFLGPVHALYDIGATKSEGAVYELVRVVRSGKVVVTAIGLRLCCATWRTRFPHRSCSKTH